MQAYNATKLDFNESEKKILDQAVELLSKINEEIKNVGSAPSYESWINEAIGTIRDVRSGVVW